MKSFVYWVATLWRSSHAARGETLSLMVTLPNEQCIEIPEAVVRWSRGQEFAVETVKIDPYTHLSLLHYVNKLSAKSDHEFSFEIWR